MISRESETVARSTGYPHELPQPPWPFPVTCSYLGSFSGNFWKVTTTQSPRVAQRVFSGSQSRGGGGRHDQIRQNNSLNKSSERPADRTSSIRPGKLPRRAPSSDPPCCHKTARIRFIILPGLSATLRVRAYIYVIVDKKHSG